MTSARKTETNVGLTATEFKARVRNHPVSFNDVTHKNYTELRKRIWQLKSKKTTLHHLMEDPGQGETLFQSDKAMQPMHDGEAFLNTALNRN